MDSKTKLNSIIKDLISSFSVLKINSLIEPSDLTLVKQFSRIYQDDSYLNNHADQIIKFIDGDFADEDDEETQRIVKIMYLYLLTKYGDQFANLDFSYQIDIIEALYNTRVNYTKFDSYVRILINPTIVDFYSHLIFTRIKRSHYMEDMIDFINPVLTDDNNITRLTEEYLEEPEKPISEYNLEDLIKNISDFILLLPDESIINGDIIDSLINIGKLDEKTIAKFLKEVLPIYASDDSLIDKINSINIITKKYLHKDNIIDLNKYFMKM